MSVGGLSRPACGALAPLQYTVQWRRDDARPLISEMREIIKSVIDFPAPRCMT